MTLNTSDNKMIGDMLDVHEHVPLYGEFKGRGPSGAA